MPAWEVKNTHFLVCMVSLDGVKSSDRRNLNSSYDSLLFLTLEVSQKKKKKVLCVAGGIGLQSMGLYRRIIL